MFPAPSVASTAPIGGILTATGRLAPLLWAVYNSLAQPSSGPWLDRSSGQAEFEDRQEL